LAWWMFTSSIDAHAELSLSLVCNVRGDLEESPVAILWRAHVSANNY
jgi:hypothetical protein